MFGHPSFRRLYAVSLCAAFGLFMLFLFDGAPADRSLVYLALFAMAASLVDPRLRVVVRVLDIVERALTSEHGDPGRGRNDGS